MSEKDFNSYSYPKIQKIFNLSCYALRKTLKHNLIKLIIILQKLYEKLSNDEDPKEKYRKEFVKNSLDSEKFPLLNEISNLWSIMIDYKSDISEKMKFLQKNMLITNPEICNN